MLFIIYFRWLQEDRLSEERDKDQGINCHSLDEPGFKSYIHEKLFIELESRNLVQENTIELEDLGEYSNLVHGVNTRV